MTISAATCVTVLQGNSATVHWTYDFIIPFQADGFTPAVRVFVGDFITGLFLEITPPSYTITGVGEVSGGYVAYPVAGSPLTTSQYIVILRSLDYTQPFSVNNQGFYPHTIEQVADWLDMQIQQLNERSGRSVTGEPGESWPSLPPAVVRKGMLLGFDATTGLPTLMSGSGGGGGGGNTQIDVGFENFIVQPVGNQTPPVSGLSVSLPSGVAILGNQRVVWQPVELTLLDNYIYDVWLNQDSTLTVEAEPSSAFTSLPQYGPSLLHLWRIFTVGGVVNSIIQMANTYPSVGQPVDQAANIDIFASTFFLFTTYTDFTPNMAVTYGQLIRNSAGSVYQVAGPFNGTIFLGPTEPTAIVQGSIFNGQATLFYYSQDYYLGSARYAANNGIEHYFANIALRRVCHRTLLTGSPLGWPAGTKVSSLVKGYILKEFQHLISFWSASGTYLKGMKVIVGGYIWIAQNAGQVSALAPFSGSYTPGVSTVVDNAVTWLCVYNAYSTQNNFWMNTDWSWLAYKTPDSHDSYASTFFSLIARYLQITGDTAWLSTASPQPNGTGYLTYLQLIENIAHENLDIQLQNFLSRTFQNNISPVDGSAFTIQFLEDNCETVSGYTGLAYIYQLAGANTAAAAAQANIPYVGFGIISLYDTTYNVFAVEFGEPVTDWINSPNKPFYPHLNSQLFPEFHNVGTVTQAARDNVRTWVSEQFLSWWLDKGKDTFPQNMFGFMAAKIWQDPKKAMAFIENTDRYFISGGGLIGTEWAYYLDTKDTLVPPFTILRCDPGKMQFEDPGQQVIVQHTEGTVGGYSQAADFTLTLPANAFISDIFLQTTAGSTMTLNIGSTAGGTDILNGASITSGTFGLVAQASIGKRIFSTTGDTTLYISSPAWGGVSLTIEIWFKQR